MRVVFKEYNKIIGQIESSYHEAAVKMNLSDSERDILYILHSYQGGCNQSVLYKESGLTKSTANTALKKMEKNGIILIQPAEGRNTWVSVTDKGHELINNTVGKIIEIENEIYDSWTNEEQSILMWSGQSIWVKQIKEKNWEQEFIRERMALTKRDILIALRHTFAANCIENGMEPKTLQKILGHNSLQMTMDLYCHVRESTLTDEMERIANFI